MHLVIGSTTLVSWSSVFDGREEEGGGEERRRLTKAHTPEEGGGRVEGRESYFQRRRKTESTCTEAPTSATFAG
jgi:hypothetical protein